MKRLIFVAVISFCVIFGNACRTPSVTTVSGTNAPENFCSGDLIFEDNFDSLDENKWKHENTLAGGGNYEFQWYINDRFNSYTVGGKLHIKPTFTSDVFGEPFLTTGRVQIPSNECTDASDYGCERQGSEEHIINPIRSARISTMDSFNFKFGTLEIRAKMAAGDWLWPALWLMPKSSAYGGWPRSGEIDLMEMRGNRALFADGANVGNEQAASTIHFGPSYSVKNHWPKGHFTRNHEYGFDKMFHTYKLIWSPTHLTFLIDNIMMGTVDATNGFWKLGDFESSGLPNPWSEGTLMAPFDQEFYIILNLAVGGINFFADSFVNRDNPKPW